MAGIYVNAGAAPGNTVGGVTVPSTCDPLFYRNGCNPRFDPIATNNLISEVLRAVTAFGDQYNCESQDNLRNAILKARNLCGLPTIAPDMDDFIAGCFDGVSGLAPIQQLQQLFGICNLPVATAPDLDDTVGMCVDGFNSQVALSNLIGLIIGQLPPPPTTGQWSQGGQIANDNNGGTLDVTGRDAFFVVPGGAGNTEDGWHDRWTVAGQDLRMHIVAGESRPSLETFNGGGFLFVRGTTNPSRWFWITPSNNWRDCGLRGNSIPYSPEDSSTGGTGTIRFYAANPAQ